MLRQLRSRGAGSRGELGNLCRNLYRHVHVSTGYRSPGRLGHRCGDIWAAKLLRGVEGGTDVVVERHGTAVAAVVSMRHLAQIRLLEADLRETALLLARAATDTGHRTELDDALATFRFDRRDLGRARRGPRCRARVSGRRAHPDRASTAGKVRVSGLHPDAERTVVRLTDAALADVRWMARKGDPQVVRWALKKLLLLERDPQAGEPLRGALIGYRKLTVGDRDWRIVWRVTQDDTGRPIVDVAEVWAVGARSDGEMYGEMRDRVATLTATPSTIPLAEAIERLGRSGGGSAGGNDEPVADREPTASQQGAVPDWLIQSLVKVVGLQGVEVARLSLAEAEQRWQDFISTAR